MANRTCIYCGFEGPADQFIVTSLRGKVFCNDAASCDERNADNRDREDRERRRNPLPDASRLEIMLADAKRKQP